MIRASVTISPHLKKWLKGNPERMTNIRRVVGRTVAARIKKEVLKKIPDKGGWFDIYRNAIVWQENAKGELWAVAGLADIELTQIPAKSSLVEFTGGDLASLVLGQYNPWTMDTIPAVDGGVGTNLIVKPASSGEVEARREALRELLEEVIQKLGLAGASVSEHELPIINGRVQADVAFLSQRLEHGFGGFPRVPHWNPVARDTESNADTWVNSDGKAMKEIEDAARDKPIGSAPIMDKDAHHAGRQELWQMTTPIDNSDCSREHGVRNGSLDFIDWDQAVAEAIGAVLEPADSVSPTNAGKNRYFLPLGGIFVPFEGQRREVTRAQVVYKRPEPTDVTFLLPSIVITREDATGQEQRLLGVVEQYRLPAPGATRVAVNGCVGYSSYETKEQEWPYDFNYTIEVWARYTTVAQMLLGMMMKAFPLRGKITVTDALGCARTYLALQEGTSDLTEVNSMVDRVAGYSLSVRMEGELTLDREAFCAVAFTGPTSPNPDPGDPEVPPADRYATGAADVDMCFKGESYLLGEDEQFPA